MIQLIVENHKNDKNQRSVVVSEYQNTQGAKKQNPITAAKTTGT